MGGIKIYWLTGSSFIDVDTPLLPLILKKFDIKWIVVRERKCWYSEQAVQQFIDANQLNATIYNLSGRARSYQSFRVFGNIVRSMIECDADLYYINYIGVPYLWPLIAISGLDKNKIIYPCHDYKDHIGVKNRKYYVATKKLIFTMLKHFQFFSRSQQKMFVKDYDETKFSFYAPLVLKGFGEPTISKQKDDCVKFLFFGNIRENKGIEYLLAAVDLLYETHAGQFCVMIYGNCDNWAQYESMIRHPECFDMQIRRIENEEIANLYASADFLMLPYRDVTQSGPLLISYYYGLPVIASDHSGFREYVEDGVTGYLHLSEDINDLYRVMVKAIEKHCFYADMKNNLQEFINDKISLPHIISLYENGFMEIATRITKQK